MKCLAKVVLVLLPLVTAGFGQSVAELLEKGIYTQETIGNLDGAIQIYRQILKSAPKQREYAAQAQYRLTECLLGKGGPQRRRGGLWKPRSGLPRLE